MLEACFIGPELTPVKTTNEMLRQFVPDKQKIIIDKFENKKNSGGSPTRNKGKTK